MSRADSDTFATFIRDRFGEQGYGLWALEAPGEAAFIGFTGLIWQRFEAPFTPALELGFRLNRPFWRRGYATEAGKAVLDFAFERIEHEGEPLHEVVSLTALNNRPSIATILGLGFAHDPADDFGHPRVPRDHALRRHRLFRMSRRLWAEKRTTAHAPK